MVDSEMCLFFCRKLLFDALSQIKDPCKVLSLLLLKSCKISDLLPTLLLHFNINETSFQ